LKKKHKDALAAALGNIAALTARVEHLKRGNRINVTPLVKQKRDWALPLKPGESFEWTDLNYKCRVTRTKMGLLCGYVGVGDWHPAYGKHYTWTGFEGIAVHGGLTFAGEMGNDPGRRWWLGYDCAHFNSGGMDEAACRIECEDLVLQLSGLECEYLKEKLEAKS
jgi:hypothetical protein